jgi:hypothetical protein
MSPSFLKRLAYRIAYCIGCRQAAGIYRHSCARVVRRKTEHQYALETAPLIEPELPLLVREFVAMLPPDLAERVRDHAGTAVYDDPGDASLPDGYAGSLSVRPAVPYDERLHGPDAPAAGEPVGP